MQDAVGVGLHLDEKYHGMSLPFKFKIGVSGCPNNCSESVIKDLGLVGAARGVDEKGICRCVKRSAALNAPEELVEKVVKGSSRHVVHRPLSIMPS